MQHIWIFQLAQALEPAQEEKLQNGLSHLIKGWKAHGTPVPGVAEIRHGRFVIVQAEPGATSGCPIDSMTHGVEDLLANLGASVIPSATILYRNAAGDIEGVDFREVGQAIREGKMGPNTLIFDLSMGQANDLSRFEVPLADSWLKRFLVAESQ